MIIQVKNKLYQTLVIKSLKRQYNVFTHTSFAKFQIKCLFKKQYIYTLITQMKGSE